jgi:hypothetical protein
LTLHHREKGRLREIQLIRQIIDKLPTNMSSVEEKKKLLSILFPEKLVFENGAYRTYPDNIFFSLMLA